MSYVLGWLLALLLTICPSLVAAADEIELCGQFDYYNSTTVPYSFNNNAWGDNGEGYSCLIVSGDDASFSVKYQWTGDASTVKGFPYVKVHPSRLPVQLWNVSSLDFSAQFRTYVRGTENWSSQEQAIAYDNTGLRANVAVDMFLSDNAENSTGLGPPIEIMIWQWYTPTVLPLGHSESTPEQDTVEAGGTNYSLYHGWNAQGQHVFSWLPHQNLSSVDVDYFPLLEHIWRNGLLSGALYLGQLEFGTEVMFAGEETIFEANNYTLKITREGDPDAPVRQTTTSTSSTMVTTATSTSHATGTFTPPPITTTATRGASPGSTANAAPAISLRRYDGGGPGWIGPVAAAVGALLVTSFLLSSR
ncbi:hypothetical protein B0A52_05755 [Exophiala mesophila]|uniref:Uncharacterized protein n=1 Tax=Exophiala mesophila TaxID=212818 RepID=A0A438N2F5_EXOME|nr:hypothetical protein B0A52_05755 [Exophiala mesophila]